MERDGAGFLSTIYTYGNQRINSESYNNLTGLYTYDGRGSVSAVIGTWGDFRDYKTDTYMFYEFDIFRNNILAYEVL